MISIPQLPAALRYPGAYIVVDGSQAGLGGDIPAVLLVGQKLATGTAPAGEVTRLAGVQDAINKAGAGSMLAQMAAKYRAVDPALDLYMLPYADLVAGVAATGTITPTAAPTANGTLALYIAGKIINVAVTPVMTTAAVATAIVAAITAAGNDIPVTAAAVAAVVTLTARHKGTCGNAIDVRTNLYGETTPAGLALTLVAMTGGAGDPVPGNLSAMLGQQRWYRYVALGINDAATLAAWHAESQTRYLPPIQAGFRAFTTFRGDYATAAAFGVTKNYEHISNLSIELNPTTTWEAAAIVCAAAAPRLVNNPVESLEGTPLPGMLGVSNHDWTNANSLLFKGMSLMSVAKDGSCFIKRLISMYQFRPDGSADDAFLDINTAEVMERIRYEQRIGAIKRFTGSAAAKSNEGYRPGLRITTVDDVRAYLLSLYQNTLLREYGWVQEYGYYKDTLVVEQHPTDPSRFNFADQPVLLSPYYILAGVGQFRKAV
ncbi:Mu tail sheath protein [Ferriphaselus amnicola]|uniref:Mu tail sheath protein n=1 Tax=Ferriphaselus amnicola TaxID=1188319 RepID=A0A2Z6GER9_9PROT|nr:phage tail protein [Ferriphaselus amnicola]BBE51784.1 Mu tail sheath protein [Ferriphaselus amnicola]